MQLSQLHCHHYQSSGSSLPQLSKSCLPRSHSSIALVENSSSPGHSQQQSRSAQLLERSQQLGLVSFPHWWTHKIASSVWPGTAIQHPVIVTLTTPIPNKALAVIMGIKIMESDCLIHASLFFFRSWRTLDALYCEISFW